MSKEQKNKISNIYCRGMKYNEENKWTAFENFVPSSPTETNVVIYFIDVQNSDTKYICENKYNLSKLHQNYKRINNFANLAYDWNDNRGDPIPPEVLNIARFLLSKLEFQPEVFPTGRDSIQFEYADKDGNYLELEIFTDSIVAYIQIYDQEYEFEIAEQSVPSLVNHFNTVKRDFRWGEIIQGYKKDSRLVEF